MFKKLYGFISALLHHVFKKLYGFISALLHQQLANELFFIGFLTISIKNHISVKLTLATYQNIG